MSSDLILDASPPTDQEWEEYKIKFSKKYNDADHESSKRAIFTESKKKVAEHNQKHEKGEVTYTMGINQFTDMVSTNTVSVLTRTTRIFILVVRGFDKNFQNSYVEDHGFGFGVEVNDR